VFLEHFSVKYLHALGHVLHMITRRLYTILKANMVVVVPSILVILVIIFGGIGMYLAEHEHQGANITKLGDAFWWAVETITTVGYGDYTPVTTIGRIIATFVMFSGIGIVVALLGTLSQRRLQRVESRFKSKVEVKSRLQADETKAAIQNKIGVMEKLTEEDFEALVIMMKNLYRTLIEESKSLYKCSRCGNVYHNKPKFCSNCGLDLT
jgi:voltage-gated potassium channel